MKRILAYSFFYDLYQELIGCKTFLKRYADEYIRVKENQKILDLGCGTATICSFFPKNIKYVGIDISDKYIKTAKKSYPDFSFQCFNVCDEIMLDSPFDIIFGEAIISGLNEQQCISMFERIKKNSDKNTRIIFSDMNYRDDDNFFQKFLYKSERNSYIRRRDEYIELLSRYFEIKKEVVISNIYIIPYSKLIFECSLKD